MKSKKDREEVIGFCPLCEQQKKLVQSHIVPAFVFRSIKRNGSGYLRSTSNPDAQVQDGPKPYLLCGECDNKYSSSETYFNTRIFTPLFEGEPGPIIYDENLLKFVIFTTFKSLAYSKASGKLNFPGMESFLTSVDQAIQIFREYLKGTTNSVEPYTSYITLVPDRVGTVDKDITPEAIRTLAGHSIAEVLITDADEEEPATCYHYLLIPQIIIFTYLEPGAMPFPTNYQGLRPTVIQSQGELPLNNQDEFGIHAGIAHRLQDLIQKYKATPLKPKTQEIMAKRLKQLGPEFQKSRVALFSHRADQLEKERTEE